MHVGQLCQKARESLGLSLEEFALVSGITDEELRRFEQEPGRAAKDTLKKIHSGFVECRRNLRSD